MMMASFIIFQITISFGLGEGIKKAGIFQHHFEGSFLDSPVATVSVHLATTAFISAKTIFSLCFLAAKLVCFILADVKLGLSFWRKFDGGWEGYRGCRGCHCCRVVRHYL